MDDTERSRQGMTVRREVLGDGHVDRAVARTTPFTAPFQDLITRYAWGDIWSRPGLSRAERSMVTLAVLATLQHEGELAMHVKAALRNGLTPDQIGEVLLHTSIYAGVPTAFQLNSTFTSRSGWMLYITGQVWAVLSRIAFCFSSTTRVSGNSNMTLTPAIRRGSGFMILRIDSFMPRRSTCRSRALMPMVVAIQAPRAVATRSVGEKRSPFP